MSADYPQLPVEGQVVRSRRSLIDRLEPYGLLTPAFLVLILFFFLPALYNFYLSFRRLSLFQLDSGGEFVGFANYVTLFTRSDTWHVLWNTLFWLTFVTVALRLLLGLAFALLVNADALKRARLAGVATTLMLVPWVVSPVVAVAVWQWLLHPRYGAVNQLLLQAGLVERGLPFLVNTDTVWWAVIAIFTWRETPFVAITLLAGLQAIPSSLYEAARIDGAGLLQIFTKITLPMLRPVIVVVTLLSTIWTFNNFVYVWLATRGGPGNFTQVLATDMYSEAFINYRLGLGASIGVLMSVVMLLFAAVYFATVFRTSLGRT